VDDHLLTTGRQLRCGSSHGQVTNHGELPEACFTLMLSHHITWFWSGNQHRIIRPSHE
jgi:hypothetical protein